MRSLPVSRVQLCLLSLALMACASGGAAQPHSDFGDGTLQGWEAGDLAHPFDGLLGNLGGYMAAYDSVAGGALYAKAPISFTGDLSAYKGIRWDEFVYDTDPDAWAPTIPVIMGPDGTEYWEVFDLDETKIGQWHQRFVSFDSTAWEVRVGTGTASYNEVVHNVAAFYMSMNTSTGIAQWESGVDNISLEIFVPAHSHPMMIVLILIALAASILLMIRRRRVLAR